MSRERGRPQIKSPLRNASQKRIKSGNYTVKRVGGGYVREPYEEERKLKDDSSVIREVNDQINHHIEIAKCKLAQLNDFTPLALFKLFDRKSSGFLTVGDI